MRKLINGKYVPVTPVLDPRFEKMTKAQLVVFLKSKGKSVDKGMTKAGLLVICAGMAFPEGDAA